ncbi:MAG: hypothetical protein LBT33_06445, partial [Spirochaetia bacterium]|nr:hypothetical protein [Spirochaetia bacterium]
MRINRQGILAIAYGQGAPQVAQRVQGTFEQKGGVPATGDRIEAFGKPVFHGFVIVGTYRNACGFSGTVNKLRKRCAPFWRSRAKNPGCMGEQYFCIRYADTKIRPA